MTPPSIDPPALDGYPNQHEQRRDRWPFRTVPTHRDLPPGWQAAADRRRADVDRAEHAVRETRRQLHRIAQPTTAELEAADRTRAGTSVPPPRKET
jgi:hypothetical protein